MKKIAKTVMLAVLVCLAPAVVTGTPSRINYQGRLLDSKGQPVSGNVSIDIALYPSAAGTAPVYRETIGTLPVVSGSYAFEFGSDAKALQAALAHPEVWLQVEIDGTPMSPRQRLAAVPYAVHSGTAESVPPGSITDEHILDASIEPAALASSGARPGQVVQWNGSAWVPADVEGLADVPGEGDQLTAHEFCRAYAFEAVAQQEQNEIRGCGFEGDGWNKDYNYHYNWCGRVERNRAIESSAEREAKLSECGWGAIELYSYPEDPAPPPSEAHEAFCSWYADMTAIQARENLAYGCGFTGTGWGLEDRLHYLACENMGEQSRATLLQSLENRHRLLEPCVEPKRSPETSLDAKICDDYIDEFRIHRARLAAADVAGDVRGSALPGPVEYEYDTSGGSYQFVQRHVAPLVVDVLGQPLDTQHSRRIKELRIVGITEGVGLPEGWEYEDDRTAFDACMNLSPWERQYRAFLRKATLTELDAWGLPEWEPAFSWLHFFKKPSLASPPYSKGLPHMLGHNSKGCPEPQRPNSPRTKVLVRNMTPWTFEASCEYRFKLINENLHPSSYAMTPYEWCQSEYQVPPSEHEDDWTELMWFEQRLNTSRSHSADRFSMTLNHGSDWIVLGIESPSFPTLSGARFCRALLTRVQFPGILAGWSDAFRAMPYYWSSGGRQTTSPKDYGRSSKIGWGPEEIFGAGATTCYLDNNDLPEIIFVGFGAEMKIGWNMNRAGIARRWTLHDGAWPKGANGGGITTVKFHEDRVPAFVSMIYRRAWIQLPGQSHPIPGGEWEFHYTCNRFSVPSTNGEARIDLGGGYGDRTVKGTTSRCNGAGVASCNLDGNPRPELFLMTYEDNMGSANFFRYKIGWNMNEDGEATWHGGDEHHFAVPGWDEGADGADIAIANLDDNPRPDMVLMAYLRPRGQPGGRRFAYKVGWNLKEDGTATRWSEDFTVNGVADVGAGAGVCLPRLGPDDKEASILCMAGDPNPGGGQYLFPYRIGLDIDPARDGGYRTLLQPRPSIGVRCWTVPASLVAWNFGGGAVCYEIFRDAPP